MIRSKSIKKLSILTAGDFPYGGAAENYVRQLALGIKSNNVLVEIILFWGKRINSNNDTGIECTNYLYKRPFIHNLVKIYEAISQILYIPLHLFKRKLIHRDQAIILYGLDRVYFVFPYLLFCKLLNIHCYRIISEIYPASKIAKYWWRKPLVLFELIQRRYFDRYLDGLIVLTDYLKDVCLRNRVIPSRILLIPHFIDMSCVNVSKTTQKVFTIGYSGSLYLDSGIVDLLLAVSMIDINSVELLIMGTVPPETEEMIHNIDMGSVKVTYTGYLSKHDLLDNLLRCTVLVIPRRSGLLADSGFPTKLGEYFATGLPVIATKVGDLKAYFSNRVELVFAKANHPESMSRALLYICQHPEIAKAIGVQGKTWASKNLDYIKNSKKLLDYISKRKK
jgi:glycosyltransferase involved in cell wall biosynthesis